MAELIEELKKLPQGSQVLTQLYTLDWAGDPEVHVAWAIRHEDGSWRQWAGTSPPKFSMGYEMVVTVS